MPEYGIEMVRALDRCIERTVREFDMIGPRRLDERFEPKFFEFRPEKFKPAEYDPFDSDKCIEKTLYKFPNICPQPLEDLEYGKPLQFRKSNLDLVSDEIADSLCRKYR